MKGFFSALAAEEPYWQAFFLLCLFTGSRRGNVASMGWAEIDMENGVWHIPGEKTKNKRPAALALCPPAMAILERDRSIVTAPVGLSCLSWRWAIYPTRARRG